MKIKVSISTVLVVFLAICFANGQEPQKPESPAVTSGTKAQDHNSTRSNKTSSVVAPDINSGGSESNVPKINQNSSRTPGKQVDQVESESKAGKKGYDYYQSKSDLKSDAKQKAPDHNSTRSNKSGSK